VFYGFCRSLRKFSELELEDDFTELQHAPDVCGLYSQITIYFNCHVLVSK